MTQFVVPLNSPEACDAGRFGPKAANQAVLGRAGLPIPDGFCLDAAAYHAQVAALGLRDNARNVFGSTDRPAARRAALYMKLGLMDQPIIPEILDPLLAAWRDLNARTGALTCVRSSALVEDRFGSSFAGQFESFIGLETESDFITAVRSCWAALWMTRALRYMATHDIDAAETAMAVLVQPLISAIASGGGLSKTAEGDMLMSATWGLGSAIAQGEVTPDRYVVSVEGKILEIVAGRKDHTVGCAHHRAEPATKLVSKTLINKPCLDRKQILELSGLLRRAEDLMGMAVEIEWAMDSGGFKLVQSRPLHMEAAREPDPVWLHHPRLNGHPAGIGWSEGPARVVNCECELERVGPGDILVTKVAGPALSQILPNVAGVVAERGGSTSHLASLARERGIPMVLGVYDATQRIPDGARISVDGVAGVVRWMN